LFAHAAGFDIPFHRYGVDKNNSMEVVRWKVFFHSINGGNGRIINDFSEYIVGCTGIFAGSVIGSCFGWKVKEVPNQEGESIWLNMKNN
jgi:hypothetical protein